MVNVFRMPSGRLIYLSKLFNNNLWRHSFIPIQSHTLLKPLHSHDCLHNCHVNQIRRNERCYIVFVFIWICKIISNYESKRFFSLSFSLHLSHFHATQNYSQIKSDSMNNKQSQSVYWTPILFPLKLIRLIYFCCALFRLTAEINDVCSSFSLCFWFE